MERMVTNRLLLFMEKEDHFDQNQSGFRSLHSTVDALARIEGAIQTAFLQDEYCVAVFLDIAKAFDTVWHHGLLEKLKGPGP
jgi:hypothetical protein